MPIGFLTAAENADDALRAGPEVSGVSPGPPLDLYALQTWLEERALEHDKPTLLLQLSCDQLRRDRIVRPGLTRLERLIATARQQAHLETFRRLTPLLTEAQLAMLDGLQALIHHTDVAVELCDQCL
jgi:hypothetical protein